MTVLKISTIIAAVLASGTSLAMAQNGLPTGNYPPVMGGAGGNPAVPEPWEYIHSTPRVQAGSVQTTRHHKHLYMTTRQHKGY